ncbi:hypothetical protein [Polaribacter sp. Q13]|uniref:hypothetical protein n=1 Tax=Polaribacter sp. Q13 TaxID=2806551 RepID=UPI00193BE2DA|nr:hypothetical protein [Polaribacter sp. Q13]QVY64116.1 hypothetical protein JOP69_10045 [Polaribacter sp. Q13]
MKKVNLKLVKVLGLSLLSLVFYFLLEHSNKINSIINTLQKSDSSKGFGIYLTINLVKWFLLIFGAMALIVVICDLLKER